MTFIVILIALLVERFFNCSALRYWQWCNLLHERLMVKLPNYSPYLTLALTVLGPIMLIIGIDWILSHWFYGFLRFLFHIAIVIYCLGPNNLWTHTAVATEASTSGDHKTIQHYFTSAYYQVAAIIFWYGMFGIFGAILYRTIACLSSTVTGHHTGQGTVIHHGTKEADTIQFVLDWIPLRLFTFMFALGGHFVPAFLTWKKHMFHPRANPATMLTECGLAALDVNQATSLPEDGSAEKNALALIDRVLIITLAMVAIIVLLTTL